MRLDYNVVIASRLDEVANLLQERGADPYRVAAYRRAAERLRVLSRPVEEILHAEGLDGLTRLPGIGDHMAHAIRVLAVTGSLPMLERLRDESNPEVLREVCAGYWTQAGEAFAP